MQTCCHPQIGQRNRQPGGGSGAAAAGAQPKTMSAVLRDLVERDRGEAQEAQRALVAAFNGLAGLALLQSRTDAAVALYGRVLELVRINAGVCDVDRLQHMHAVANLSAPRFPDRAASLAPPRLLVSLCRRPIGAVLQCTSVCVCAPRQLQQVLLDRHELDHALYLCWLACCAALSVLKKRRGSSQQLQWRLPLRHECTVGCAQIHV